MREIRADKIPDDKISELTMEKSPKQQVFGLSDIFKDRTGNIITFFLNKLHIIKDRQENKIKTVLTTGEAEIGKSFHVQKFIKAWAEKTNRKNDVEVIFQFNFSKLKLIEGKISLVELLNRFFEETKESVISDYAQFKITFILDGLNSYDHNLDFDNNETLSDVRQPASVNALLTNLIKGNLLPSARVWITSRPSAAAKPPVGWIDRMTEIRGKVIEVHANNQNHQIQ